MDPNRLKINFPTSQGKPGQGFTSDRTYQSNNEGVYPTTPSTFPQPVFQSMQGNQEYLRAQMQSPTSGNYEGGQQSYFGGTQYHQTQQQFGQQTQYNGYQQQSTQQPLSPRFDPNSGLARQFSNQNLGSNQQRQQSPFGRQPPSNAQQYSSRSGQTAYGSHLSPSSASEHQSQVPMTEENPPEKDPNKYSSNVLKRVIGLHVHVEAFFKDNINRARERNTR